MLLRRRSHASLRLAGRKAKLTLRSACHLPAGRADEHGRFSMDSMVTAARFARSGRPAPRADPRDDERARPFWTEVHHRPPPRCGAELIMATIRLGMLTPPRK